MAKIDLKELYVAQAKLDKFIQDSHHVSYEETSDKRLLALLVELGELANETRTFKFWSLKGPSEKSVILDEYADALHFYLSLGIIYGSEKRLYTINKKPDTLTEYFIKIYASVTRFQKSRKTIHFEKSLQLFLNLLSALGYKSQDLKEAYFQKLAINYARQQNHY